MNDFVTQFNNVLTKDSVVGPSAPVRFPLGAASLPSITFTGDLNTGMWSPAADTLAWSLAGAERMRINTTGIGIGTTDPADLLHVQGSTAAVSDYQMVLEGQYNGYGAGVSFQSRTSSGGTRVEMARITADGESTWNTTASTQDAGLRFFTTTDGTPAERLRINAAGDVGVGTSNLPLRGINLNTGYNIGWSEAANDALAVSFRQTTSGAHVIGSGVKQSANANAFASSYDDAAWGHSAIKVGYESIKFYVNAAATVAVGTDVTMVERMHISALGNIGVGTTASSSDRLYVRGAGTGSGTYCFSAVSSLGSLLSVRDDGAINTGTQAYSPYYFTTATAANMVVDSSGWLLRSTSSIKYKEDIRDYSRGLAAVMSLRPVFYKSKGSGDILRATEKELAKLPKEYDADGKEIKPKLPKDYVLPVGPDYAGFIAEEVHTIAPEFVQYADDGTPDALSYGHMTALLCKAIQEQQALIVALTARVAKLEK